MRSLIVALSLATATALAVPRPNSAVPKVAVEDIEGRKFELPDAHLVTIVIYEDKDAGAQNQKVRDFLGPLTDRPEYRSRFQLIPVADVEKYDFWPAKKFVLEDLRKISKKESSAIYCDWKGRMRKLWGLTPGKSGVLLMDTAGHFRFAGEGPLSDGQIAELRARLKELGIS